MKQTLPKILLFIWICLVLTGAFLYAPLAKGLDEMTRVFYFHVPMAWLAVVAYLLGAVYSILYLKKKEFKYDMIAEATNKLGFLFIVLATVTGSIWAKMNWGSFWNWDPRESSIFILMLIYAAYFALRSAVEQPERRASLSAVYDLLAFVSMPFFIFILPRIYEGLHPDVIGEAIKVSQLADSSGMRPMIDSLAAVNPASADTLKNTASMNSPKIMMVFFSSLIGFSALFYWMIKIKIETITLKLKIKDLEE